MEVPKSLKEKTSKEDEQTLANSAHRHPQAKCRLVQNQLHQTN